MEDNPPNVQKQGKGMATASESPAAPLHSGDRVTIRSGGPMMTVLDVGRDTGQVWCRWMTEDGVAIEGVFPAQALWPDPNRPRA